MRRIIQEDIRFDLELIESSLRDYYGLVWVGV